MSPSSDIELPGALRLAPGVAVERMGEEFLALVGQRVVRVAGPSAVVLAAVQRQAGLPGAGLPPGVVVGPGEVALAIDVLVELGVFERTAATDAAPDAATGAAPDAATGAAGGAEPVSVSRRRALRMVGAAAALGVTVLVLPQAAAAASGAGGPDAGGSGDGGNGGTEDGSGELDDPTFVTAEPIGYQGSDTGAIRVTWSPVNSAAGYEISWSTDDSDGDTFEAAGDATSYDLTDLVGTDTTHSVVVRATNDVTSLEIGAATSSSVIATGGTITLLPADGTQKTHVVHTFTGDGTFKLNREIVVEHLVVGGGGGGGGCTGRSVSAGGGGGGGVVTGSGTRTAGAYAVVVGAGGRGGPDATLTVTPGVDGYARGGENSNFGEVVALGGGAGGSAPFGGGSAESGDAYALPTPSAVFLAAKATGGGGVGQATRQLGATGSSWNGGDGTANTNQNQLDRQLAGGGGGAGQNGTAGSGTNSGSGGHGVASDLSGTNREYGSGGGGGKRTGGSSGPGGALPGLSTAGGSGGLNTAGSNGVAGRGGGGGGAGRDTAASGTAVGGDGGSGVVIVRFELPS
jgi:hypothetical protein